MKCFEKKLPHFSIIYLHNPFKCKQCLALETYDGIMSTYNQSFVTPVKKIVRKRIPEPSTAVETVKCSADTKEKHQLSGSVVPIKKKKAIIKQNLSKIHSETVKKSPKTSPSLKIRPFKKVKGKSAENVKKNPVKHQVLKKKVNKTKEKPAGKGTLKRKRWFYNKMKESNDNYEDDIFENKKFEHFQSLLQDDTDTSDKYDGVKTPVFPFTISPREKSPSPTYRDCYSPTELSKSRKGAEEYLYRKGKRKFAIKKSEANQAKKEQGSIDVDKTLKKVAQILNERQAQLDAANNSDEDFYFSDN